MNLRRLKPSAKRISVRLVIAIANNIDLRNGCKDGKLRAISFIHGLILRLFVLNSTLDTVVCAQVPGSEFWGGGSGIWDLGSGTRWVGRRILSKLFQKFESHPNRIDWIISSTYQDNL